MERLTELNVLSYLSGIKTGHLKFGVDERKAFDLLAAYEDTGLTPEEVSKMAREWTAYETTLSYVDEIGGPDRLLEFVQAEKDGRLVMLPCKVGDTIYNIFYGEIIETKVRTFFFGHPSHHVEKRNLRMIRKDRWDIPMCDLGKTVFLTREEADAALKKRKEADNETD